MRKVILFILFFVLNCYCFDHFEKYCVCYDDQDCLDAILSCNKIVLGKDINKLHVMNKNVIIDCNKHKISNLIFENSGGTIKNCVFENTYVCLEIKYKKSINLTIKNNIFDHCYKGIIIKSNRYGNISIENNTLYKNKYGLILYTPINKIINNTFKNLNKNILVIPCEMFLNKTICEKFKKINVEGNYFAIYKNGKFILENLNTIKDKDPKKEDPTLSKKKTTPNKKNKENNNSFLYTPIVIFVILGTIFGIIAFLKYKKRNEDEFEW